MMGDISETRREAPTDARQVRSRSALAAALLELLEERPFDQLTIREITARAGTGYATFFRHYPDKEALLHDVAAETQLGESGHDVLEQYSTRGVHEPYDVLHQERLRAKLAYEALEIPIEAVSGVVNGFPTRRAE